MGRAFEYRKARKLKRWGNMARVFTKYGKEITMAAKDGGPDPDTNPRLRVLIQSAKRENMPKDNIDRAIKRAVDKDFTDYKNINYEGYAPHGIAVFVETATDNNTRTVANVRSYFNKFGGSLGTTGSLEFLFDHKYLFHLAKKEGMDLEEFELSVIDYGVDEIDVEEDELLLYGEFSQNAALQSFLESEGYEINSVEFVRIPKDYREVTSQQAEEVNKLIDKLEEDEDVQNVFTNMKEPEGSGE